MFDLQYVSRYNDNIKGGNKMAKKSITTTFRLNEDDYLKFKELKEKSGRSWTKMIAHLNKILEQELKNTKEK